MKGRQPEGEGEEPGGGREVAREARERARQLRSQAELAWGKVQRAMQQEVMPSPSARAALREIQQIPAEEYAGGIGGSLVVAGWLYAAGHEKAALNLAVWGSLVFGLGLAAKLLRDARSVSQQRA